jgi:hypothetical protein
VPREAGAAVDERVIAVCGGEHVDIA